MKKGKPDTTVAGGFTPSEAAALHQAASNTDRTPSAVLAAFCPPVTEAGGLKLVPYSAQQRIILEATQSPFLKPDAATNAQITVSETCFAIWVLSQSGEQLRAEQRAANQERLNAALNAISEHLPGHAEGLAAVRRQLCAHLAASCVTVITPGLGSSQPGDPDPLASSRGPDQAAAGSSVS
ncbi:MAG: hypothetical protein HZA88_00590 [Verrucomicrobia bacterium]|nr:hypothetical protein [Verrucomicrobiota bacterium]